MARTDLLLAGIFYLLAAVIMVPVAVRCGLGAVLGYLLAGVIIGPWGLGIIHDVDQIMNFAELGVVFLMFLIGLELNPQKLWSLRRPIFGTGTAQVLLSAALLGGVLWWAGFSWKVALIGGLGLAMSSTAIGLQLIKENKMNYHQGGQLGFSILLFQDMAVIPAMALIPLLASGQSGHPDWAAIALKVVGFLGVLAGGGYLLRPILRIIASTGVREVFTAATLLLVLGAALLMEKLGVSMALGTFLAGVLLGESEYRHELEVAIDPFKGLLLGLFFISVGMELNLDIFKQHIGLALIGVLVLLLIKSLVLYGLGWLSGLTNAERLQLAGVLGQGGEFAFVLFSAASSRHILNDKQLSLLLMVVTLSMMLTPLVLRGVDFWLAKQPQQPEETPSPAEQENPHVEDDEPQVIVVGFGRFGQATGRLLMANKVRITVLERDIEVVNLMRRYGYKVYYGDATELELLRAAGAEKAKAIVITCDNPQEAMEIIELCQQHFPRLCILARARGRVEAHAFLQAGVHLFTRETFLSALDLGRQALIVLGLHPYQAQRAIQHFKRLDQALLRKLAPRREDEKVFISRFKAARHELEDVFQQEMQREKKQQRSWEE